MKKGSLIKVIYSGCLLVLIGMLYWSSVLQENDLKRMRLEMKELRLEMVTLNQKFSRDFQPIQAHVENSVPSKPSEFLNLLADDPFYTKTLPHLLGDSFKPQGILKRGLIGKPESLHPFNGFKDVTEMIAMCTAEVATLKTGCYESMTPSLGIRIEQRGSIENPEYWIFLRSDLFWEPLNALHFPDTLELAPHFFQRHKVTAHDFKFFYDAVMNTYIHDAKAASLRTYYSDIDSFRVVDETTFVITWKQHQTMDSSGNTTDRVKYTSLGLTGSLQPLPRFVYQYFVDGQKIIEDDEDPDEYRKNSVWAQNFSQHWAKNVIVSCGPYLFDGMNDESISFKRNPHYHNPFAVLIEGVKYSFKESFDAVWQDFKSGKIDLCTLSPNQLMELNLFLESDEYRSQEKHHLGIQHLDYVDMSFYYIGWNQAKPFFSNEKVRKALTLAIDRSRIIEQNLNLMAEPITGPFFLSSSAYDSKIPPHPFDPEEARRILDDAGWIDMDGDGIRDKMIDGQKIPFHFKLYYFVKSLSTKVIAEYITSALRNIGVHCELCGLDLADLSRQFEDKSFDAIFMGWKLGTPPEDPRQLWHSAGAKEKGSSNAIGFENGRIDQLIEQLSYEYDQPTRVSLYHQFHQIIHQEAPYTFLYTPKVRLLFREYVHNLFIPRERQDLIPGADIGEPNTHILWLSK